MLRAAGRTLLLGILAVFIQAQQEPAALLSRVRARAEDTYRRLPNYMCTQTVDRTESHPVHQPAVNSCDQRAAERKVRPVYSDRLRLDVAASSEGELYSWVGESRFHERGLFDLVKQGSMSTGSFRGFLGSVFHNDGVTFTYLGETSEKGRLLASYGFRVPLENSHYVFGPTGHRALTGYDGTFQVDPKTADLVRLVILIDRPPPETGACESSTTMDYGLVRLNDTDFQLPTQTHLHIRNMDGAEMDNTTVYSGCHEFVGESEVTFGPPGAVPAAESEPVREPALALPEGVPFRLVLTQDIPTATAAAGDRIAAKLATAIHDASRQVLVPAGTPVVCRILRISDDYSGVPVVTILFRLEALEIDGAARPFNAIVDSKVQTFDRGRGALLRNVELGTLEDILRERGVAKLKFWGVPRDYVVKRGMESNWVTGKGGP